MKRGISLILLMIMILIVIILGFVCVLVINNNSSFFNIKEYKKLKADVQLDINNIIYRAEEYMGRSITIEPGYINYSNSNDNFPIIRDNGNFRKITSEDIPSLKGENLDNIKIYLNENGIITLKYLIFNI